jgi:hypothetical protein
MANAAEVAIISKYLDALTVALSGPYTASVVIGAVSYVHVVSQLSPELWEDVICDFSTDPPGYLTAGGTGSAQPMTRPPPRSRWRGCWPLESLRSPGPHP